MSTRAKLVYLLLVLVLVFASVAVVAVVSVPGANFAAAFDTLQLAAAGSGGILGHCATLSGNVCGT